MKLMINRLLFAVCLIGLAAFSTVQLLYAQETTILLPLIETNGSTATDLETDRQSINKAPLFEMVPVRDCSQPNTIVWGRVKQDPEPRYEIYVSNRDGSGTRWDGFSNEAMYTFSGSMPERVQLARKDNGVVSGWTQWYTIKECATGGDGDNSNTGSSNNLTNVVIRNENGSFFTIIWKGSPGGNSAAVDVYRYERSGNRDTVATGKWDNSGWIDGNQKLCQNCASHSVTVNSLGTISVAGDETLYELIWHGSSGSISTFGKIDSDLNWTLAEAGNGTSPTPTDTPTPTFTPTATATTPPAEPPTATPTNTPSSPPQPEPQPQSGETVIVNGNFDDATDTNIVGWETNNGARTQWNASGRYLVATYASQTLAVPSGGSVTFSANVVPDSGSASTNVEFALVLGSSTSVVSINNVNGWDSFSTVHSASFNIPTGVTQATLTLRLASGNLARIDNVAVTVSGGNAGEPGPVLVSDMNYTYQRVFTDEFNTNGTVDNAATDWRFVEMARGDGLHFSGNADITADGLELDGQYAHGKRWSAWYNSPQEDEFTYVRDGNLVMGGRFTDESDPTRRQYSDQGMDVRFDRHKFYTSFLTSWDAVNRNGAWVTEEDSPEIVFEPGTFFEMRVSFAEMQTRAFRLSFWLMPALGDASNAYDANYENGVEVDLFEYEVSPGKENTFAMKVISSGDAPNGSWTPNSQVDVSSFNIRQGYHTVGLLWLADKLVWYVDGSEVQRDEIRVPQTPHYMIISREMNSGAMTQGQAREGENDLVIDPPYRPWDYGLYAFNVWRDRYKVNSDRAKIDYVRVWSVAGN